MPTPAYVQNHTPRGAPCQEEKHNLFWGVGWGWHDVCFNTNAQKNRLRFCKRFDWSVYLASNRLEAVELVGPGGNLADVALVPSGKDFDGPVLTLEEHVRIRKFQSHHQFLDPLGGCGGRSGGILLGLEGFDELAEDFGLHGLGFHAAVKQPALPRLARLGFLVPVERDATGTRKRLGYAVKDSNNFLHNSAFRFFGPYSPQ